MSNPATQLSQSHDVSAKVAQVLQTRIKLALERFGARMQQAGELQINQFTANPMLAWGLWSNGARYAVDVAQRSILFWDTLRQRGNNFIEHERQGMPPVLHFEYEVVMDGRSMERAVNYALVRIIPPKGVTVDAKRRPYVIIDPRGGHGPGIGGFKDDSQVGVALREGHPVYFVIFFPNPEPGQTLLDVCNAQREFVHRVRELHPDAPKPGIVGNCQAGWAAMMLAAANPDDTGPVVVVGAPMSYWGGAWREAEGDNPMRYAGGLLGGAWLASLASDLGAGKFDGASLVQNFENLNPANTFWDKYHRLFADIDTEADRFLEFERWWGGYFLLNREEIEWITQNLFVGNKLWSGDVKAGPSGAFDLRNIKAPIVLFASLGDNITPPQQAFNWVADVYGSTEEIKARGQVIVGLMHEDVGHLGIFVSGKVAKKEGTQIASVLKSIEALPPGLYGMKIAEKKDRDGKPSYEVSLVETRLEDVVARLNRFKRADEKPFEAANVVSEFNQRLYELFGRPLVKAFANEYGAKLSREFHPLRFQRWAFSDFNPALSWLAPAAHAVKAKRQAVAPDDSARQIESTMSEVTSAWLDCYRALRDALAEATFFQIYGNLDAFYLADKRGEEASAQPVNPRELPFVKEALASIEDGGYAEALARVAYLMAHEDVPLPLSRLHLAKDLIEDYRDLLPKLPLEEMRRIGGEQEIIARYEREKAIETLPVLLSERKDRERLLTLLDRVLADKRVQRIKPSVDQAATLARIRSVLGSAPRLPNAPRHGNGSGRTAAAPGSSDSSRRLLRTSKAGSARRRANGTGQSRAT
jgi:pimeloyl-ACP methyl ester carboxylesterase